MQPLNINPFRPGAGHMPPYLAGREAERKEFLRLIDQDVILENMVLTGLRGVGKTVLLETFKPLANEKGWLWVGSDLSEAASVSEETLAIRLTSDLAIVTTAYSVQREKRPRTGFAKDDGPATQALSIETLRDEFRRTPGLCSDGLKAVLELAWLGLQGHKVNGVVFAYDEAQTLSNQPQKDQYPLSLLLDVFQSIQRKGIPFLLVLTGLPTLFPKLVEARTFSERMFRVVFLDRLDTHNSSEAILRPIKKQKSPIRFSDDSVELIVNESGGYPYFLQFICREVFDVFLQHVKDDKEPPGVPLEAITRKLDQDFFAGRWARVTDRQRQLLFVIARLESADHEFSVQDIVKESKKRLDKPFGSSHVNQMLASLADAGLVYRNRHGKYSFAVPLLGRFILRQMQDLPE